MKTYRNVTNFPATISTHDVEDAERELVERALVHNVDGKPRVTHDIVEVPGSVTIAPGETYTPTEAMDRSSTFQNFVTARTLRAVLGTRKKDRKWRTPHLARDSKRSFPRR